MQSHDKTETAMSTTLAGAWQRCREFHGHSCPGLAIGVRACEAAGQRLGLSFATDEEVVCVSENDACGVDAVQVLTGCTVGKGNLLWRDRGKMAFTFFCRTSGGAIRLVFKKPLSAADMDRQALQSHILTAPLAELFDFKEPSYEAPSRARLLAAVVCRQCGESCTEQSARFQDGQTVCLDCLVDYERGWPK